MNRRIAVLSALTLSLLLSACSKDKDDDAADDAQAQAEATAEGESAPADDAPAPPPPRIQYWPVLGPLVAGSYSGSCMRKPDLGKTDATITVGADGKAASNGLALDFGEAPKVSLMRVRDDKGAYGTSAMFAMRPEKDGFLNVSSLDGGTVSIERENTGLMCSKVGGTDKLNSQPLHLALAGLINGKTQTVGCRDLANIMVVRDVDVGIEGSVIRIGDAAYDMKLAATEMVSFDEAGESMSLSVIMADQSTAQLIYDGAGALTHVNARNKTEATHACEQKR